MGTERILRITSSFVNGFSYLLNRLLQKSPNILFLAPFMDNYARQRQLPPFFCTKSRRASCASSSSSVAKTMRNLLA
ncbi:hypothetical protein CXP54_01145 [Escherichia albertii]|nr:hypothetical protein CXP54_01145 [Escherichia albertii]EFO0970638.1 hypothetical protein [Escherichia albertii]EFO1265201.1 hypothetical protein [Escherichia albertii]EFO4721286.1 hypothetical protein [Escherichia albertii]